MKIVDSHAHIGRKLDFNMPLEVLLQSMLNYNIDYSLVSSIESVEADHNLNMLKEQISSVELAEKTLKAIEPHSDKVGMLYWVKPHTEVCSAQHYDFIRRNRSRIFGLKVHPYHSKLAFDDLRMHDYFEMARHFDLPIATHTAADAYSHPEKVFQMATMYKDIQMVMVHMGLGTDNQEAIRLIKQRDNLFGDSTWVSKDSLKRAFQMLGSEKLLFGTDNPIDGRNTLGNEDYGAYCLKQLSGAANSLAYENFMGLNAIRVFKLSI